MSSNKGKTFACPYCFGEHELEACRLTCMSRKCDKGFKNEDGTILQENFDFCIKKCKDSAVQVICPDDYMIGKYNEFVQRHQVNINTSFNFDIPDEVREGEKTMTVAVIGGASSGKTCYLTVFINELSNVFCEKFGCNFRCLNVATEQIYDHICGNNVYNTENKRCPEKTVDGECIPPLLYRLEFSDGLFGKFFNTHVNLAFYDIAGEDLQNPNEIITNKGYIANADLVILLLDPLQIGGIREKLKETNANLSGGSDSTTALLNRLITVMKTVKKVKKIGTPLAVTLSKMDVIRDGDFLAIDSDVFHESEHVKNGAFTKSDFNSTQKVMESLLQNYADNNLLNTLKNNFKDYALFGFSAFGYSPVNSKLDEEIEPFRVLDPLIWGLNKKGIVKTFKEEKVKS